MIDTELLQILVCPETKQSLRLADPALLERVNQAVADGSLRNRGGEVVAAALEAALVRQDDKVLYPVRDDIPIMLLDEAIELGEPDADAQAQSPTS